MSHLKSMTNLKDIKNKKVIQNILVNKATINNISNKIIKESNMDTI